MCFVVVIYILIEIPLRQGNGRDKNLKWVSKQKGNAAKRRTDRGYKDPLAFLKIESKGRLKLTKACQFPFLAK